MSELKLIEAWKQYCKKHTESKKIKAEANKLYTEFQKLEAESKSDRDELDKLFTQHITLRTESRKLSTEADMLWISAVKKAYSNTGMEWRYRSDMSDSDCILANGDRYTVEMSEG